jgi:NADH dehydrogenase/NADH:ubiquinone oxidoreductase subunit G
MQARDDLHLQVSRMNPRIPPISKELARASAMLKALDALRSERSRLREEMRDARGRFREAAMAYLGREPSAADLMALELEYVSLSAQVKEWRDQRRPEVHAALLAALDEKRAKETPTQRHARENYDPAKAAAAKQAGAAHTEAMEKMRAWMIVNGQWRGR